MGRAQQPSAAMRQARKARAEFGVPTHLKRLVSHLERHAYALPLSPGFTLGRLDKVVRMAKHSAKWDAHLMLELARQGRSAPMTRRQMWLRAYYGIPLGQLPDDAFDK
jgi:hypothetical protein